MNQILKDLLGEVIDRDLVLRGFGEAEKLPEAAKLRIANTMVSLEKHFEESALRELESWFGGEKVWDTPVAKFGSTNSTYYVMSDGSLYWSNNADSEVWAFADDFAVERIHNGYEGPLDEDDTALLKHLGGYHAEAVEERGTR